MLPRLTVRRWPSFCEFPGPTDTVGYCCWRKRREATGLDLREELCFKLSGNSVPLYHSKSGCLSIFRWRAEGLLLAYPPI